MHEGGEPHRAVQGSQLGNVSSSAERLTLTRHHHRPDLRILGDLLDRPTEIADHHARQGIEPVRAIQSDHAYGATVAFQLDQRIAHHAIVSPPDTDRV